MTACIYFHHLLLDGVLVAISASEEDGVSNDGDVHVSPKARAGPCLLQLWIQVVH